MMDWDAFFAIHDGLPREGPGEAADVLWAARLAGVPDTASIADVGCGPGADIAALLQAAPGGRVCAIDAHAPFVAAARARHSDDPRVSVEAGDMAALPDHPAAPFDMIWSAGALYFLGPDLGPATMARALKPGGVLAFTEPAFFTESPSPAARALWEGYPTRPVAHILRDVAEAGFAVLGHRALPDSAWQAYHGPLVARARALRGTGGCALDAAVEATFAEVAAWRAVRFETGYVLVVARRA